jgi:Holliday junction resolvase RusA-like endonuclease
MPGGDEREEEEELLQTRGMTPLSLFIAGLPKGQPRPKACIRGRHAGVYDPGTADDWKMIVRHEVRKAWNGVVIDGPVSLSLVFYMPRPKSHYGRSGIKDSAPIYHIGRPDADNLAKAVMDALSNLNVWEDDSAVCSLTVHKLYSKPGSQTGMSIVVCNPIAEALKG